MRLTESQLRRIIKEEIESMTQVSTKPIDPRAPWTSRPEYQDRLKKALKKNPNALNPRDVWSKDTHDVEDDDGYDQCYFCDGTGKMYGKKCKHCAGSGVAADES